MIDFSINSKSIYKSLLKIPNKASNVEEEYLFNGFDVKRQGFLRSPAFLVTKLSVYTKASTATLVNSSGVNGLGMKLNAPSCVASMAVSIDGYPVIIITGTFG